MKKILLLLTVFVFYACNKNDDEIQNQSPEIKEIKVNIIMPESSTISTDDLTVSTLFTEDATVSNSQGIVEIYNSDTMELVFATNSQGNIVLLSYFIPSEGDEIIMNSETTAIALVMLNQWTFDLSDNAKKGAFDFMKNLPQFQNYKTSIENSISSGEINPLVTSEILNEVSSIQYLVANKFVETHAPIKFEALQSTVSARNIGSSAAYGVGLYDHNDEFFTHKLIKGVDKSFSLFPDYKLNQVSQIANNDQFCEFQVPTPGRWTLKAKSGLSFDDSLENDLALSENMGNLSCKVIGLFSSKLGKLVKASPCVTTLGENVISNPISTINLSESLQSFSQGSISGWQLTKDCISYIYGRSNSIVELIKNCVPNGNKLKPSKIFSVFELINIVSNIQTGYDGALMLKDWYVYDKEIEFCFEVNDNQVMKCGNLVGTWNMVTWNNGTPVNTVENHYTTQCPSILSYTKTKNGSFTFSENGSFSYIWNDIIMESNISYDPNTCQIFSNGPDTLYGDPTETGTGNYTYDGTKYSLAYSGWPEQDIIQFISPTRIKIYDEEYVKQ